MLATACHLLFFSCLANALSMPISDVPCGALGDDLSEEMEDAGKPDLSPRAFYFEERPEVNTRPYCEGMCLENARCRTFATRPKECLLFDQVPLRNINFNPKVPKYRFFKKGCDIPKPVCNAVGWDLSGQPNGSPPAYDVEHNVSGPDVSKVCFEKCAKDPKCVSYAVSQRQCNLYDVPVIDSQTFQHFLPPNTDNKIGPFMFSEKECEVFSPNPNSNMAAVGAVTGKV